jgi:hypothetical protein
MEGPQVRDPDGQASGILCETHYGRPRNLHPVTNQAVARCMDCQHARALQDYEWYLESLQCAYCGKTDGPYRMHSGVYECQNCWDWRKLDSGAARYWYILSRMVGSSVDAYDLASFFPQKMDLTPDEIRTFGKIITQIAEKTGVLAHEHGTAMRWQEQAQELYDKLQGQ